MKSYKTYRDISIRLVTRFNAELGERDSNFSKGRAQTGSEPPPLYILFNGFVGIVPESRAVMV